jgi:hypothetical protein
VADGPDADLALLALMAMGLCRWDAMVALVEGGVPAAAFPGLESVPKEALKEPYLAAGGAGVLDQIAKADGDLANAILNLYLEGRTCEGGLHIGNRPWIRSLPAGLRVGGDLNLEGTQVERIGAGLWVDGRLSLHRTPIQSLPAGLTVQDVDLSSTGVAILPQGLRVAGLLILEDCHGWDGRIPEDAVVGQELYTCRHPYPGLSLRAWRQEHPEGERGQAGAA